MQIFPASKGGEASLSVSSRRHLRLDCIWTRVVRIYQVSGHAGFSVQSLLQAVTQYRQLGYCALESNPTNQLYVGVSFQGFTSLPPQRKLTIKWHLRRFENEKTKQKELNFIYYRTWSGNEFCGRWTQTLLAFCSLDISKPGDQKEGFLVNLHSLHDSSVREFHFYVYMSRIKLNAVVNYFVQPVLYVLKKCNRAHKTHLRNGTGKHEVVLMILHARRSDNADKRRRTSAVMWTLPDTGEF